MKSIVRDPSDERRARILRLIEQFRREKQRRTLRRARRVWRQAEIHEQLAKLDAPRERIH